jgi:hypothetical protein
MPLPLRQTLGDRLNAKQELVRLLNATLAHAARHSPYYARMFDGEAVEVHDPAELRRFPILTRELVARHEMDLLVRDVFPEYVACTGGTTLGSEGQGPLRRFHTERERGFWVSLHESMRSDFPGDWPVEVRLITMEHGLDFPGALRGVMPMPLERPSHFLALTSLLDTELAIPGFSRRVRWLSGSLTGIKPLTLLCMERGIEGAHFGLELVCVHGWHVTPRWQKLLQDFWNAPLGESYGLSEVPGLHAVRCGACSHFHFSPLAMNEVLDLDSDEPVARGVGRVVSTSLYPLNQTQPLLRYDTEDVIEVASDRCEQTDRFGFEYLGRKRDIVRRHRGGAAEILCHPIMLSQILGDLPDIALRPHFRVAALELSTTFGWQKYKLVSEDLGDKQIIRLEIELVWSPRSFPDAAKELSTRIGRAILNRSPALQRAISEGDVELAVTLREPNSTDFAQLV